MKAKKLQMRIDDLPGISLSNTDLGPVGGPGVLEEEKISR